MKTSLRRFAALAVLILAAGCSSPNSRIDKNQSAFNTWPVGVQEKVRAGQVDVGFTTEMVLVALGEPDRRFTRTTAQGTSEVWGYFDHGPKFSIGVGVGSSRGSTGVGGGVVVGNDGYVENEIMRVIFSGGRVVAIERQGK